MDWVKAALLTGLLNIFFMNMALDVSAADYGRGNACRRGDRLRIEDLDVSPDPIVEGTRIRSWKVRLRFDGNRECETEVVIKEGGDTVAQARNVMIRPGLNEIDLRPSENYRFRGREHCFNVQADLEGSKRNVDAARKFCAQQKPAWTMREANDRNRSFR
jgi:hypothetical protein